MFPGTCPTRRPFLKISYRSGTGPDAGPDQRNDTPPTAAESPVSPAGRKTGAGFPGVAISTPATAPMTATAAMPATAHRRRRFPSAVLTAGCCAAVVSVGVQAPSGTGGAGGPGQAATGGPLGADGISWPAACALDGAAPAGVRPAGVR